LTHRGTRPSGMAPPSLTRPRGSARHRQRFSF